MTLVRHALKVVIYSGMSMFLQKTFSTLYRAIWPFLPIFDFSWFFNPYLVLRYIGYERLYLSCIDEYVDRGETVTIIGGGEGVSAVAAAQAVGTNGRVSVFEGGHQEVERSRTLIEINGYTNRASVTHAIVTRGYSIRSSVSGGPVISADDLPQCDTLAIDADGAEIPLLQSMNPGPDRLIVEHHAVLEDGEIVLEYQPGTVRELITDLGYQVLDERAHPTSAYGLYEERIFVAGRPSLDPP